MLAAQYSQYQNNSVLTASQAELTLMLYNGAIKFCNIAIEGLETKDIKKSHINIIKAQDIIMELQATLNYKYPIAKEFGILYDYILQLLIDANVEKNEMKLKEAKELITEFRDVWKQIMKKK